MIRKQLLHMVIILLPCPPVVTIQNGRFAVVARRMEQEQAFTAAIRLALKCYQYGISSRSYERATAPTEETAPLADPNCSMRLIISRYRLHLSNEPFFAPGTFLIEESSNHCADDPRNQ